MSIASVQQQMAANAAAWHTAKTQAEKDRLKAANQSLGASIGGTYHPATGTWTFPTTTTPSTPAPTPSTPKPTTPKPSPPVTTTTPKPTTPTGNTNTAAAAALAAAETARAKRLTEMQAFTGWDNDPAVRSLQEATWMIYVDTGRWDSAQQKALHEQAEKVRQYNNPMYTGSPYGPTDWMDAAKITPPDTTPNANGLEANIGSYLKTGGIVVVGLFALMIFGRR